MTELLTTFALVQAAGAAIGAGGAVFAEIFYLRAIQDGKIDTAERAHLLIIVRGLKWGMILLLVGSIGLVVTAFAYAVPVQPAETHAYWVEMGLVFAIIFASWALRRKLMGFMLSSAAIFTGWWFLAFLVFGRLPSMSVGEAVALYLVTTTLIMVMLLYARMLMTRAPA